MKATRSRTTLTIAVAWILILSTILSACNTAATPTPAPTTPPTSAPVGPTATAAPATAAPAAPKFSEAPMLADMVKAGKLPPVEERLPKNPLIVPVTDSIGQYGGVWRRGFLGPSDYNGYVRIVDDALVRFSPDGTKVEPKVCRIRHLFGGL